MVVDQRLLGVGDGVLNGVQLLAEFQAGAMCFDHGDDRVLEPGDATETLDDRGCDSWT